MALLAFHFAMIVWLASFADVLSGGDSTCFRFRNRSEVWAIKMCK